MLLTHTFPDPQLNLALELFLRMIKEVFEDRLVSVVLYGSVTFDDLAPGYGDLDFLAVVEDDVSEELCRRLVDLRKPLRSGDYGILCEMIEGAFLPRKMLDPANAGAAFWWGTSGERPWHSNQLGWLVLHVIREHGIVIWGQDTRNEIPASRREDLLEDVRAACRTLPDDVVCGNVHSVDWLLTAARLILWLKEGRLSSKSEAADWGYAHARGAWRDLLPRAKQMRLNPSMADSAEAKQRLQGLASPIREALRELEEKVSASKRAACAVRTDN